MGVHFSIAVTVAVLALAGCSSSGSSGKTGSANTGTTSAANGDCAKPITVAATLINISSGSLTNATAGVPSVEEQQNDWNLVAKDINKSGGAKCRNLEMKFFKVNPVDIASAQQTCLQIADSKPFVVVDSGALTEVGASDCIPAHKVPVISTYLTQAQLKTYYPYYLSLGGAPDDAIYNGVLGLNKLGYFSPGKGFKKLGLLYHSCTTDAVKTEKEALAKAGVSDDKISDYDLGCPAGQTDTPASMEQAVLSFKNAGVSTVTEVGVNDFGIFSQVADQQKFKPQYAFSDAAIPSNESSGQNAAVPANLDGAVDVVGGGYGEATTPGYKPSGGTAKCNAIYSAAGIPSVYKQPDGYGGFVCNYLWLVQALVNHAPTVQGDALAPAMHSVGRFDASYAGGPIDFSAAPTGVAYGVSYWRAVDYHESCKCWLIPDPTFNPPFKK
jgi:hypothetical protein